MDETGAPGADYSGERSGLQDAAADLSRQRDERDQAAAAEAAKRPEPRARTPEEDDARDFFRKQAVDAVEDQRAKDGRKLTAHAAAEALAKLREYEGRQDEAALQDEIAARAAETPAQQQAHQDGRAVDPSIAEMERHPKFREAVVGAEQVRGQYRGALMQVYQVMLSDAAIDFREVETDADIQRLAATDPARFQKFQASAQKLYAAKQAIESEIDRSNAVERQKFQTFAADQDARFYAAHPELSDRATFARAMQDMAEAISALGFDIGELVQASKTNPLLRDHRVQALIYQAGRYHAATRATRHAAPRSIPQVQRPGTAAVRDGTERTDYDRVRERNGADMTLRQAASELVAKRAARRR